MEYRHQIRVLYAWFGRGIDRYWRRAGMRHVGLALPHLDCATLLRHGGQESGSSHLLLRGLSAHGRGSATALVPSA